jgi:V8-like Glu-specific endopeptidase
MALEVIVDQDDREQITDSSNFPLRCICKARGSDSGAIILPEAAPVGFFGYTSMTDDELCGRVVSFYGYPGDKPSDKLWGHYRKLRQALAEQLLYTIATMRGQSDAP